MIWWKCQDLDCEDCKAVWGSAQVTAFHGSNPATILRFLHLVQIPCNKIGISEDEAMWQFLVFSKNFALLPPIAEHVLKAHVDSIKMENWHLTFKWSAPCSIPMPLMTLAPKPTNISLDFDNSSMLLKSDTSKNYATVWAQCMMSTDQNKPLLRSSSTYPTKNENLLERKRRLSNTKAHRVCSIVH